MQKPRNPTSALFQRFCQGVVRNAVAAVQQAVVAAPPAALVSWLQADGGLGQTPLHYAAQQKDLSVMRCILPYLVRAPATSSAVTRPQLVQLLKSAAATASHARHTAMVQLLHNSISSHVEAWAVSPDGTSPHCLCLAASMGDAALMQQQLANGETDRVITEAERSEAASTAVSLFGIPTRQAADTLASSPKSALEAAIKVDSLPMVQLLLAAATPQQLAQENEFSAMQFAVTRRASPHILQQLLSAGAAVCNSSKTASVLGAAAEFASAEVVSSMLAAAQQGSSSSRAGTASGRSGWPTGAMADTLHAAAKAGRVEVAGLLLQTGDPELSQAGCKETALHCAIQHNHPALVALLLRHGADVNGRKPADDARRLGAMPLYAAILRNSTQIMQCLLDAGADPQIKFGGKTALQHAMQHALTDGFYNSTDPFECLIAHSSQRLSAAELISTAWSLAGAEHWGSHTTQPRPNDHNMPNWVDKTDEDMFWISYWGRDADDSEETQLKRDAQHSMMCSLLQAAAAKDSTATQAALAEIIEQVNRVYSEGKSCFESSDGCTCGNCIPEPIDPQHILRAQLLLEAVSAVWLNSEAVDVTAQRTAVQRMLVSATASLKQLQHMEEQQRAEASSLADMQAEMAPREQRLAEREQEVVRLKEQQCPEASSLADRQAEMALREQQLAEKEREVVRREQQVRAWEERQEQMPLAAAAKRRRQRL